MNASAREEALFQAALPMGGAERAAFLDRECAADPALRARLEALLAAHDQPGTVFGTGVGVPRPTISLDLALDLADDLVGQTIGRYKLLEKLGEGGCGVVYVAEQTAPVRRRVALKIIKLGMDTKQVVARFEAERQALAMMDHPNIAKVLDAGTTERRHPCRRPPEDQNDGGRDAAVPVPEGRPYFVMELVRGIRITDYCDQERLATRERLDLFIKVCQAIQHAHQKGIIHRDIKPSNILVTLHDGVPVPKVIDFGIAKATEGRLTDATVYTQLHQFIGTPAYMSPEQAEMSGLDIDTRSDIYSLGVLLYELLTGTTPFDARELMAQGIDAMRRTIREQEPLRPSTRLTLELAARKSDIRHQTSEIESDLDWIVMKCLEKDRGRRYETANGLAADLKRHLNNEPVVARPPSAAYRFQKAFRRNKLVFAAGTAVAIALVLGAGISLWQAGRAIDEGRKARQAERAAREHARNEEAARAAAVRERDRAEEELWKSQLSEARALRMAGGVGARLGGETLLRELVKRPNLTEAQMLALRQEVIGQLALVDIALPTNWVAKASWQPLTWDAPLQRFVRSAGSNRLDLCAFPSEQVLASFAAPPSLTVAHARFTPNDEFLVARFEGPAGIVWAWRVDTQEVVLRGRSVNLVGMAPDSRSVLLVTPCGVVLQPLRDTRPGRLLQPGRAAFAAAFSPHMNAITVLPRDPTNTVELWNPQTGETESSFSSDFQPFGMAWHPDGMRLALGGDRGRLELRRVTGDRAGDGRADAPLPLVGHQGAIRALSFTPDGALLMSYAWDRSSILWDPVSGRALLREPRLLLSRFGASTDRITALREWPMSESVAMVVPRLGYRTMAWAGKALEAWGAWVSPDSRLLAVGYNSDVSQVEGDCLLWDIPARREVARLKGYCAQFSADSRTLYTFARYTLNQVRSFDVSPETLANPPADWQDGKLVYQGRPGRAVNTGACAADGRMLVIAATDALVFLDTLGQQAPRVWGKAAHAVGPSHDGRWIATMLHNHLPVIWSTRDGRAAFWGEHRSRIEFSPDSRCFSLATETEVRIYATDSMRLAYDPLPLEVPGAAPPVAFSPDGRVFAVALNRTHPRLFETATGRELATFSPPHPGAILEQKTLNFSPDGEWLVAVKHDGETVGWNLPVVRAELGKLDLDWTPAAASDGAAPVAAGEDRAPDLAGLFTRPARDPSTPPELLDLSRHYNASLTEHWCPGWGSSDLSELPHGVQRLGGVPFDIRGLIQCGSQTRGGEPYPSGVSGIAVGQPARRLHFLHAAIAAHDLPPGFGLGRYVVHYADGQEREIPIRVGHEVADWRAQDQEDLSRMRVAWTGQNAASRSQGRAIRLFMTTWENPRSTEVIQRLDLIATHLTACPFLVAVTAE